MQLLAQRHSVSCSGINFYFGNFSGFIFHFEKQVKIGWNKQTNKKNRWKRDYNNSDFRYKGPVFKVTDQKAHRPIIIINWWKWMTATVIMQKLLCPTFAWGEDIQFLWCDNLHNHSVPQMLLAEVVQIYNSARLILLWSSCFLSLSRKINMDEYINRVNVMEEFKADHLRSIHQFVHLSEPRSGRWGSLATRWVAL